MEVISTIPKIKESFKHEFRSLLQNSDISELQQSCEFLENKLCQLNYFKAPASAGHHLNVEGGLFIHSMNVTKTLLKLTEQNKLTWSRPASPYIIGLFHDLCKCDLYKPTEDGKFKYSDGTLIQNKLHGEKSAMVASTIMRLTEEEMLCITYHMGAYTDKENWNTLGRAVELHPNIMYVHLADMIATHVLEVE